MLRTTRLIGSLIVATVAVGVIIAAASAQPSSTAIGPNQAFIGLVNGKYPTAIVTVACPGPGRLGQTGHPVGNQTIGLTPAPSTATTTGFTGSRGKSIVTRFGGTVTSKAVTFTTYGTQAIPTSLAVPCSGSGSVSLSPRPKSKTARSASVMVTYENIAVTPTARSIGRTITVTQADSGKSYRMHKGDRLDVALTGPASYTWTEPTSSNSTVLQRKSGSSGSQASGLFVAARRGKATVSAVDNPNCYPRCLLPSRLFEVSATVTG